MILEAFTVYMGQMCSLVVYGYIIHNLMDGETVRTPKIGFKYFTEMRGKYRCSFRKTTYNRDVDGLHCC